MKITIVLESTENGIKSTCSTDQVIEHAFDGEEKVLMAWLVVALKDYTKHGGVNGMLDKLSKEVVNKVPKDSTSIYNDDLSYDPENDRC